MAKRKKTAPTKNDTKIASIVLGLFVVAIVLIFIISKSKEPQHQNVEVPAKPVEITKPVENIKPEMPAHPVQTVPYEAPYEAPLNVSGTGGKVAIILDDWGQTTVSCKYLKEITEPLAVSILPGLRHTKDVANCAQLYHKLTMLHLPLEALHNGDFYPPDYIIKTTMKPALVSKIVDEDMDQLPSIEGVNNHMGSKATEDRSLMRIIYKKIKKKGLFFVDSMTAPHTVCASLANEMGVNFGKRDVFLDNINTREAIIKQFVVLAQKARRRGYAVAIGHDRPVTMQLLKEEIHWLEKQGLEIVSIKELLRYK